MLEDSGATIFRNNRYGIPLRVMNMGQSYCNLLLLSHQANLVPYSE